MPRPIVIAFRLSVDGGAGRLAVPGEVLIRCRSVEYLRAARVEAYHLIEEPCNPEGLEWIGLDVSSPAYVVKPRFDRTASSK